MRLSDAIALGRVVIKPFRGRIFNSPTEGCALGMGLAGIGRHGNGHSPAIDWPWLHKDAPLPCGCYCDDIDSFRVITHIFDDHIMGICSNRWTLDQLIDWVRSVEPNEPEECAAQQPTIEAAGFPAVEHATK